MAQPASPIDKGAIKLGGQVSLTSSKFEDSDRMATFTVTPQVQYFVTPGLAM